MACKWFQFLAAHPFLAYLTRFRMAACLLLQMSRDLFPRNALSALLDLPEDLFQVYDRFLKPIPRSAFRYVEIVLRWLIRSAIPVTLQQLEEALAFHFLDEHQLGAYDPNNRGDYASRVCELLAGLVTVVRRPSMDGGQCGVSPPF